ncbi:2TM domain-containing protein [Marinirhabdus gelatinilytica]|uniref:2TM domain-containing protein n=1 Tax=Marinirhabdus gelatinilytica TaxID=1703343 RepID=A0A370QFK5_9FLAO|nr:2TM domain-containing protein [Marinirhabdus gelatinilytica]RDK87142.1 2TM domain-containing protein [Marinirhabdus gelatinilytica]
MNSNNFSNKELTQKQKLEKAKKRVEKIKGFYSHAIVYAIVNLLILLSSMGFFTNGFVNLHMPSWGYFTTPFFWGIGLFFHGLSVFKTGFLKKWEQRKIQEYLEKEERDFEKFN